MAATLRQVSWHSTARRMAEYRAGVRKRAELLASHCLDAWPIESARCSSCSEHVSGRNTECCAREEH